MKKIFALILVSSILLLPGCLTTNWHHNLRHFKRVRAEVREWHQDFDMIFFGVEPEINDK